MRQLEIVMNVERNNILFRPEQVSGADIEATLRVLHVVSSGLDRESAARATTSNSNVRLTPLALAKRLKNARNVRNSMLPPDLFGEPAWDILLALYVAECEQYRLKVSAVLVESNVPSTTGLRWVETLVQSGLVMRKPHATDARVIHVQLTVDGMSRMTACLSALSERHF
jgi:DNA-binding MarR family transcriptional regulator